MLRKLPSWTAVIAALVLNFAADPTILSAQQQQPADVPSLTIRTSTRLIVVDVVVTNKSGQPVPGLKPEDFTVEENGKKQKVSVFVPPGMGDQSALQTSPPGVLSNHPEDIARSGPLTVLVLDAANSPFREQAYARLQMLKYVLEQGQAGHSMAVVTLTNRLRVLQQFTSDPQVLMTAIKNFKPQEPILQNGAAPISDIPSDAPLASSIALAQAEIAGFTSLQTAYDIERRTLITIDALSSLARMLGGLPGRKNVVWLTANLPFDLIPEDRTVSEAQMLADLPGQGSQRSVAVNAAGSLAAEQRSLHGQEIREAEARLASANIAIYPADLHGLVSGQENLAAASMAHSNDIHGAGLANAAIAQSDSLQPSQGTMREIAAETGGKAYINQNEIKEGIALAVADDKASYAVGYYPDNKKWDGKFRKIKVKLENHDAEVRYRKGYFAFDPTLDKNWKPERDVLQALEFNASATQVLFKAQAKPTDPGKVRVVFLVDAHTLTAEDSGGNKKMNVVLYATVWGSSDKSLVAQSIKVEKAFDAATYQQILDHGMMVPLDVTVPAGGKELRLAVLDNKTGFIGTVSGPLGQ